MNEIIKRADDLMQTTNQDRFNEFVKLFELSGNSPEQSLQIAKKEVYHLANIIQDSITQSGPGLSAIAPEVLLMEIRKIPLQGVTLDPALKLAYLYVTDKNKGRVTLEINGRGKLVQAIAQGLIKGANTEIVYEGDTIVRENGLNVILPGLVDNAKVKAGIITVTWPDGSKTQEVYTSSHINSWKAKSAKKFGSANGNYTSFNNGVEPGFMKNKMLKHWLDRIGINPFPNAVRKVGADIINSLPEVTEQEYVETTEDNMEL